MKIDEMELSVRSSRVLKEAGVETLQQLYDMKDSELLKIKSLGKKSLKEIRIEQREWIVESLNKTGRANKWREDHLKWELNNLTEKFIVPLSKMENENINIPALTQLISQASWYVKNK